MNAWRFPLAVAVVTPVAPLLTQADTTGMHTLDRLVVTAKRARVIRSMSAP